jgi:nitrogen fixation-related uncharacterized protein
MNVLGMALFAAGSGDSNSAAQSSLSAVDLAVFATVIGSIIVFGTAAVLAMGWAFRSGQFDNFQQGALSIFGPDEPVGETTDAFPADRENTDRS